ncbi:hypothetical protein BJY52DRAFT_1302147 [Lactarius psammicola]|nr:hypothetical protein BJY52DRAFT_1302147 [Lactarius psammicola]
MTVAPSSLSPSFAPSWPAPPLPILSTQTEGEKGAPPPFAQPPTPPLCRSPHSRGRLLCVHLAVSAPSLLSRKRGRRRDSEPPQSPPPGLCHPAHPPPLACQGAKRDGAPPHSPLCLGYFNPILACRGAQEGQCAPQTPPSGKRPRSSVYAPRPARAPHLCTCAARERKGGRTMRGREREPVTVRARAGRASGAGAGAATAAATQQR